MHTAVYSKNAIKISDMLLGFVRRNFCEDDANTNNQYLLYTRIRNYLQSANKKMLGNKLANEINAYLNKLRRAYPEIGSAVSGHGPSPVF